MLTKIFLLVVVLLSCGCPRPLLYNVDDYNLESCLQEVGGFCVVRDCYQLTSGPYATCKVAIRAKAKK